DIPKWLSDAVDRLLQKDPTDRYQTASEVAEVFAAGLAEMHLLSPLDVPAEVCAGSRSAVHARTRQPICWASVGCRVIPWVGGTLAGLILSGFLWMFAGNGEPPAGEQPIPQPPAQPSTPTADPGPKPRVTLAGKSGAVWALAFMPDNQLVSGAEDGSLKVWDIRTGEEVKLLSTQEGNVWSLDVSADGRFLVTAADEPAVTFWDLKDLKRELPLAESPWTKAVAFSPDGKFIATGNRSGLVTVWDWQNGIPFARLHGHTGTVHAVAYSPDGTRLVTAGSRGAVKLWELKGDWAVGGGPAPYREMALHTGAVYAAAFSPDGSKVATAGWDRTVRIWDAVKGTQLLKIAAHEQDVWSVAFSGCSRMVASGGGDGFVKVWDLETGKEAFSYRVGTPVHVVRFAPDGTTLAAGSRDGSVRVWDVKK
ncbi:MAG: hypothetical protein K2V38_21580, partial [Gemmataceae bacterium]|nr:hypothetical protein [Gemmataceae bacterium]